MGTRETWSSKQHDDRHKSYDEYHIRMYIGKHTTKNHTAGKKFCWYFLPYCSPFPLTAALSHSLNILNIASCATLANISVGQYWHELQTVQFEM